MDLKPKSENLIKESLDLKSKVENLSEENKKIFERIFEYREIEIELKVPEQYSEFRKQKLLFIKDKVLGKGSIFNLSRRKRKQPEKAEIEENYDPFCNFEKDTPIDEIGRLENESAVTSANLAKMADYHSLIIFKKHKFEEINSQDFKLAFNLAKEWFEKIKNFDKQLQTFILIWNYHYRSGASILHPHFQILAYKEVPITIEDLFQKIKNYNEKFNSDYFQDYFKLAQVLGLGKDLGNFKIWFSLTPYKEKGMNFIGDLDEKIFNIINKLESQSFNLFYLYESPLIQKFGFFVDRGEITKTNSDFGALEIFGMPVISSDPFELSKKIFQ